jgi:small-conductance mechanosensitive channel
MSIWQRLGDMFLDQAGGVDEKRVLGIPILIAAVVYVLIVGKEGLPVFAAVAGLGTLLLGIGVAGDQGKLGSENPSKGVSQ